MKLLKIETIENQDVYDITVKRNHNFIANGIVVHNCVEIGMLPTTEDGRSGFQGCNLTEINGRYCDTKEKFLKACEASAIIGTLQAGYTSFKYLTKESQEIFEREALLGCSITGMMDNPEILFDETIQKEAAKWILETNKKVAKMLGINPAARATAIKPAGCLAVDQIIRTTEGNKSILEIFNEQGYDIEYLKDLVDTWLELKNPVQIYNENNEIESVSKLYVCGIADTLSIPLADNTTFECTPWHMFKLTDGTWKRADKLETGDDIMKF